jgi:hypothetical protein
MKESHFELPRSQYMESQSQKSRASKACCPPPFDFASENGDTNEGSAFPFSSPKKIVSWEMVLQECDMNTAEAHQSAPIIGSQSNMMPQYRFFPNSFEESVGASLNQFAGSPPTLYESALSCGAGSPQQPHPLLPGMNSVMSFLLRGDSGCGFGSNYSP